MRFAESFTVASLGLRVQDEDMPGGGGGRRKTGQEQFDAKGSFSLSYAASHQKQLHPGWMGGEPLHPMALWHPSRGVILEMLRPFMPLVGCHRTFCAASSPA